MVLLSSYHYQFAAGEVLTDVVVESHEDEKHVPSD